MSAEQVTCWMCRQPLVYCRCKRQKTQSSLAQAPGSAFVRLFKPQFAPLVESGQKCQTVRPTPRRMPNPGDKISLRTWTGKPYRSKQRVLRESVIVRVEPFDLDAMRLWPKESRHTFARADGFEGWPEMLAWFIREHGYPFVGITIHWQNAKLSHGGGQ
jgi:hypothetical protein